LVVAAKALKPGTVVALADLKTIPWPTDQLPKGAYETPDQIAGSTVFDAIDLDEPVLAARLASSQSGGGSGVPTGMRAVSIHVTDSTGVLALLKSGQKVDVQVVVGRGTGKDATTEVRTALEGLSVLTVTPQPEQSSQGQMLPVVTLLAKPGDADVLALADSGARVRMTLRNPLDGATRSRSTMTLGAVMRGSAESR
jgi:pilus assembly protein CpaB